MSWPVVQSSADHMNCQTKEWQQRAHVVTLYLLVIRNPYHFLGVQASADHMSY